MKANLKEYNLKISTLVDQMYKQKHTDFWKWQKLKFKYVIKASLVPSKTSFRFLDKFTGYYLDKFIYIKSSIKLDHSFSYLRVKPIFGQWFNCIPRKIFLSLNHMNQNSLQHFSITRKVNDFSICYGTQAVVGNKKNAHKNNYVDFGQNTKMSSMKCGSCRSYSNLFCSNRVSECKQ